MIGGGDQALFLHALDDAGGAVVADLQMALHEAGGSLAMLQNHGHGTVVEVVAAAFAAEAAAAIEIRFAVVGDRFDVGSPPPSFHEGAPVFYHAVRDQRPLPQLDPPPLPPPPR